ncbi:hypothetical protein IWW48_000063 [Coemansia sp. RSA 1200]|nr:hypothetical protein IWW48_000063 [Coemansia sp. RSA 1200]
MPNAVTVCDSDDIHVLLNNNDVNKASHYRILRFTGIDNTLSFLKTEDALVRHRQMGSFLKSAYLSKMEDIIMREGVQSIKQKWDTLLDQSKTGSVEVNYSDDIIIGVFAIISTLIYGKRIKELNGNSSMSASWIKRLLTSLGIRAMVQLLPSIISKPLLYTWEHYYTRLSNYTHEAIAQRKHYLRSLEDSGKDSEKPADLLQALIDAEDTKSNSRLSYDELHAASYLKKTVSEIRSQFCRDHIITYKECCEQLPFLEACIFESLRLEPVTGGTLAREAPKGGLTIKEHFIPEGATVTVNFAAANRHCRHWDNPLEFNPTRFLYNKSAQNKIMTFSYGRRTCSGRQLA